MAHSGRSLIETGLTRLAWLTRMIGSARMAVGSASSHRGKVKTPTAEHCRSRRRLNPSALAAVCHRCTYGVNRKDRIYLANRALLGCALTSAKGPCRVTATSRCYVGSKLLLRCQTRRQIPETSPREDVGWSRMWQLAMIGAASCRILNKVSKLVAHRWGRLRPYGSGGLRS